MKKGFSHPDCPLLTDKGRNLGILLFRVSAGGMMLVNGLAKIINYQQYVESFADPIGLGPALSLNLTIFAEAVCALAVILGFMVRLAVVPLIVAMSVAAFATHPEFSYNASQLALLYLGCFVALFFMGAGRYSLDSLIKFRYQGVYKV